MQPGGIVLLIIAFAVIGITFTVFVYYAQKKRREALAALANRLGWTFNPASDPYHDEQFRHFKIFTRGHSRRTYNTLRGSIKILDKTCKAKAGDYLYKETHGSGKDRRTTTYRFSYLIVDHPYNYLPALLIRPEGIFDKLKSAFGFDDINFESAEFSRRFYVKSQDKRFAYNVIDPRMMEFLLASSPAMLDIQNNDCCLSDGKKTWTPEQFNHQISWIIEFFNHWPDYLVEQLNSREQFTTIH